MDSTPVDVVALSLIAVQGAEIVAASIAVGFLFLLISLPGQNQMKVQNAFLLIELFCLPVWFVSLIWWVLLHYIFVVMYVMLNAFGRLVRQRVKT
ncbi:MAG: hypothetical protein FJ009_06125 [Chloroflexi bacterium]|nr:hypothetical protein [Chloroflexota bacterium]